MFEALEMVPKVLLDAAIGWVTGKAVLEKTGLHDESEVVR